MKIATVLSAFCVLFVNSEHEHRAKTEFGHVKGRNATTIEKGKRYTAFQGVPYAKPPTGERRFSSPVSLDHWDQTLDATKPKPTCIEMFESKGDEDCLYLNIFTPALSRSLPVMVWFPGGAFISVFKPHTLDGVDNFIDQDIVVVTVQYRLGAFGFLSTEDTAISGNFGLKDQLMAVEFVIKNIKNFGGDPKKITLAGQGSGAASVQYLSMHKKLEGKINGIIQQSGSVVSPWALSRNARSWAYVFGGKMGLETRNSFEFLKELRKKSGDELKKASERTHLEMSYGEASLSFTQGYPVREVPTYKEAFFNSMAYEELKKGNFGRVPKIIGLNSMEGIYKSEEFQSNQKYYKNFDEIIRRYLPEDLNSINDFAAKSIKDHYTGGNSFTANISNMVKLASDNEFVRPILKDVYLASPFVKTYLYHFTYEGKLGKPKRDLKGVDHGEELEYLFTGKHQGKLTKQEQKIREKLVKLWCNFVKTGNPTPGKDELFDNQIWEPVNADTDHTVSFEIDKKINVVENPHREDVEFWERIYAEHGHRPYDTY